MKDLEQAVKNGCAKALRIGLDFESITNDDFDQSSSKCEGHINADTLATTANLVHSRLKLLPRGLLAVSTQ